jgi:GAF domain-containing protein
LPDTSGEELYRLLRAHSKIAKIPIIILSAAAAVQKRIQLLKMGADDYIIKPFNVDDLLMRATVHIKLGKIRQAKNEVESRIDLLGEIAKMINSSVELNEILATTIDSLKQRIQVETCDIFLPEQNFQDPFFESLQQLGGSYLFQAPLDNEAGITVQAFKTGEPGLVNEVQTDGRFDPQTDQLPDQVTENLICVPLFVRNQVVCVLRLINKTADPFTADDLSLVVSAANIITVALDNAYLQQLNTASGRNAHHDHDYHVSLAEEIGTPLQTIQNYLEMAIQTNDDPTKQQEILEIASSEIERLIHAVHNR